MRKLVPAFAFALIFSSVANAASLTTALQSYGCSATAASQTGDTVKAKSCYFTALHLCQNLRIDQGECRAYGFASSIGRPSGPTGEVTWTKIVNANAFEMQAEKNQSAAYAYKNAATQCCGPSAQCGALASEAATASAAIAGTKVKSGANPSADETAKLHQNGFILNSDYVGLCNSAKRMCNEEFAVLRKGLGSHLCETGDASCPGLVKAKDTQYEMHSLECDRLSSQGYAQQAAAEHDGAGAADKTAEATKGQDPSSPNSPAAPAGTADNSSSGGSSGLGKALQGMLPGLLSALTGQPEPEAAVQPQSIGDCNTVGPDGLPVLAGCPTTASKAVSFNPEASGESNTATASNSKGAFNLADNADSNNNMAPASTGGTGTPITTTPVPGGGGGFAGGGGATSAQLGGAVPGGGHPGSKVDTTVFRGEGGGGGGGGLAALNSGIQMQSGQSGGGGGAGQGSEFENIRLSDYLPGGPNYKGNPERGLAGMAGNGMQIQSKSVNIWNRVSDIFRSRCAQGLLRDCGPR